MDDQTRAHGVDRVAEAVRRALRFVGPPEHERERTPDDEAVEEDAVSS